MPTTPISAGDPALIVGHGRRHRSERLLELANEYSSILIVGHDNPDPDALAAGWAILKLIEVKLSKPTRLIAGGGIVRAENRHMVQLLGVPIELVSSLPADPSTGIILVDCHPDSINHVSAQRPPIAVIDHHKLQSKRSDVPFRDIRPGVAATATIAASYLRELGLTPDTELATALTYAIRTETRGAETRHSLLDRTILKWLVEHVDPNRLAEIENAPLSRHYYGELVLALQNTFLYGSAAFCFLPRADEPEIVGEVADLLIRCEGIHQVLCAAVCREEVLLSARTDESGGSAVNRLTATLRGLGRGGGHERRAGGKLVVPQETVPGGLDGLETNLRDRWLKACDLPRRRGVRLVARREILEHLD